MSHNVNGTVIKNICTTEEKLNKTSKTFKKMKHGDFVSRCYKYYETKRGNIDYFFDSRVVHERQKGLADVGRTAYIGFVHCHHIFLGA